MKEGQLEVSSPISCWNYYSKTIHSPGIFVAVAKILLSVVEEDITKIRISKMVILSAKERLEYVLSRV